MHRPSMQNRRRDVRKRARNAHTFRLSFHFFAYHRWWLGSNRSKPVVVGYFFLEKVGEVSSKCGKSTGCCGQGYLPTQVNRTTIRWPQKCMGACVRVPACFGGTGRVVYSFHFSFRRPPPQRKTILPNTTHTTHWDPKEDTQRFFFCYWIMPWV